MLSKIHLKKLFSNIVIVNGKRTPMGSFMGKISKVHPSQLASVAIEGALKVANIEKEEVDEVIMGNVLSAGLGQAPARQAALHAGLSESTICTTINKVCSSGMKSIHFAAQSIMTGNSDIVVAGGMESMSLVPHYIYVRLPMVWGEQMLMDGIKFDGLTDSFSNSLMGSCMEKVNKELNITREEQDDYCMRSYELAIEATKAGLMTKEIIPFEMVDKKKGNTLMEQDEECFKYLKDKIPKLKPVFEKDGTITAANASKNADGACAMVLMTEEMANQKGLKPIARIKSFADSEMDPVKFSIAPSFAIPKLLKRAGIKMDEVDAFEIGEAFSGTVLANQKLLNIPMDKLNVHGGAVSLGHPIGMSGARIVLSLINVLQERNGKYGVAGICNGGGGATSICIERL